MVTGRVADRAVDVLLVGAGPASDACATELRERGFEGSILLVGRELDPPYDRPPCSKELLRGETSREGIRLHPEEHWEQRGIELLTRTSVTKLDPAARSVQLSSKQEVVYGQALLATGAMVRRLNVEGSELEGIHYLRAPANAEAIHKDAAEAQRVVLVGGSYIGCEVAASMTMLGKRCTILMQEGHPLERGFGPRVGAWARGVLEAHEVEIVAEDELDFYRGDEDGHVEAVVCGSGRALEADLVVIGAGALPDVMVARAAGLSLGASGGIECDSRLRTSADSVWAAGDVCEYDSAVHGRRLRVEHWEVALAQGRYVAASMLGKAESYSEIPYFWSDIGDWTTLEYVGPAQTWDRVVVRGSIEDGEAFSVWYVDQDRLVAALAVGRSEDLDHARRLIKSGVSVAKHETALCDVASDLSAVG